MVLNYIWIGFFLVAFVFGVFQLCMGDATIFQKIVDSTFDTSKTAFEISLGLTGVLALWLGIMKIGERAGVVNVLAKALSPVFTKLFPDIPRNHPAMGSIFMNIASNMLGLDNAATPTGLKAMQQMCIRDRAQSRFEWVLNALRLVLFRMVIRCYTHGGIDLRVRKS